MDRRQKKRIIIFLLVPILASILFISEDLIIRLVVITLLIIYVAFIIFLRDSLKFSKPEVDDIDDIENKIEPGINTESDVDEEESFRIISKPKKIEVITAENYSPSISTKGPVLKPNDLKERFEEIVNEELPKDIGHDKQFTFVLEKMLAVLKEAYQAHTAIFFWYNKHKDKLSIEKFVSNSKEITKRNFDIEDDILSKIVQNSEPEFMNDISAAAEADVIRYYNMPEGIKSFVGVPLFYNNKLIAIVAMDSKSVDVFGIETIYSLGRFVRVITMLISIFEEKFTDSLTQQRLRGLLNLIESDKKFQTENDLVKAIRNSVTLFLPWDAFAFIYYSPVEKIFKIISTVNNTSLKYVGNGLQIDLSGTLTGKSITTGMPVKIDDTSLENYLRYSKSEDVSFDGSFLAVPVMYDSQIYGVVCFESLRKNAYSNQDIQFLKNAFNFLSYILYSFSTEKFLKNYIAFDVETKLLNAEFFKQRLKEELYKADQLKITSAVAVIKIDDFLEQESLFDGEPFPKVLQAITEMIKSDLNISNVIGRLSQRVFGIYFFNSTTKDVFLWAEKLRIKIARKPIAVISKQTTYTISVGIASAKDILDAEEVLYNADLALQKAVEKGGNAVRNIN